MSLIAVFDMTVRNWCKNLRSLSWWPWTQAPTWTLCPSLTIQCRSTLHLSWSFLQDKCVAINNLPQLNSFNSYSTRSFSQQHLFISSMPKIWIHYLFGITDRKSSRCWSIVCSHLLTSTQSASPYSVILCLFQLGSWQESLAQLDCLPSLRQQCHVFLRHATLSKMVALSMAAMEFMVLAGCSCVFVWAF